ncbi:MAG TPA: apolipoprotein N-acyltransferase [Armatimonadota bacterium]|nr:apolipoprotein N-acyltransferase [Armatimonadota bacterium]
MTTPIRLTVDSSKGKWHNSAAIFLLPLLGGLLLSISFPNEILPGGLGDHPFFLLGWIALIPALWGVFAWQGRQAIWASWLFAIVFYLGTLSWMRLFGFLPWCCLACYLSLIAPISLWITRRMALPTWSAPLGFALTWTGIEWLRSQSIMGFSWSEIGASQVNGITANIASLGSVYLISFLMLLLVGCLIQRIRKVTTPYLFPLISLAILVLCVLGGWYQSFRCQQRWAHQTKSQIFALVQPSIQRGLTPEALVTPLSNEELLRRQQIILDLSHASVEQYRNASLENKDNEPLVVWSESAIGYPPYVGDILNLCRDEHCHLLAGAVYFTYPDNSPRNSAYLFNTNGLDEGRYDKIHLVPFGEFVPFRSLVSRFYTVRSDDLTRGSGWIPLQLNDKRLGVGVCFESTFPSIARDYANRHANYLIYITNDAWFHETSAVRQHFNHARFRAIETGLPVVRTASTGISGIIAPDGAVQREIPTYATGTQTVRVPIGIPGTVYTTFGWLFAPLCFVASMLLLIRGELISRKKTIRQSTKKRSRRRKAL